MCFLSATHPFPTPTPATQVQSAARDALAEVGRVIGSPEMAALVPSLMAAIADPNAATKVPGAHRLG